MVLCSSSRAPCFRCISKIQHKESQSRLNSFNYFGNLVSYEKEKDIDSKVTNILKITGIINNTFKPNKVQKGARIKLYATLLFQYYYMAAKHGQ
jgi:hypothetical protein